MGAMSLPSNIHACCGAYWAGPVCRRCGKRFDGQPQELPANGPNLQNDGGTAMGAAKPKRRKRKPKAASMCHLCGKTLPPPMEIAESLICEKCKQRMTAATR